MAETLLVELFTEELPPKALKRLGEAFADQILNGLVRMQLTPALAESQVFATPRRLAVLVPDVLDRALDRAELKKLMPAKVAFDSQGKPSNALLKRLEKEGIAQDSAASRVERRSEGDTEYAFVTLTVPGVTLAEGLQAVLKDAVAKLPIPKVMRYRTAGGADVEFVRPAHGLVALHGSKLVPVSVLGLVAGRATHGHRFQGRRDIILTSATDYDATLRNDGKVIAGFGARREEIRRQLDHKASELGFSLRDHDALLDEVTALVEYPTVYVGEFEQEFLEVPAECLILTMQLNQKYFPLFDAQAKLTNWFLIVSNMELLDPSNIVRGNQRVVRPRLADARFFFEQDKKVRLADRVAQLASVVYHNKLGSQLQRTERVSGLASVIAGSLNVDTALAERAAYLAKADLLTHMVGEFPELQGIMGRYYALHDGEQGEVANAIAEHYLPKFAGDVLPTSAVSVSVALADKLEALAGLFGIGQQPTGDKDPFALRRHALGVLRMLIELKLDLDLHQLVNAAFAVFDGVPAVQHGHADLETFLYERLRGLLREQGFTALEVESVICQRPTKLEQLPAQLSAVRAFMQLPEAQTLVAANKRVANILKKSEEAGEAFARARSHLLREPAERELYAALEAIEPKASALLGKRDYAGYLRSFAALKGPVDSFFDSVMVMVEDKELRSNRVALLTDLRDAMNRVADISKLAA